METLPRDVLMELYLYLDDIDLTRACQSSKTINIRTCQNNIFWLRRISVMFPDTVIDRRYRNFKEYYVILKYGNGNPVILLQRGIDRHNINWIRLASKYLRMGLMYQKKNKLNEFFK